MPNHLSTTALPSGGIATVVLQLFAIALLSCGASGSPTSQRSVDPPVARDTSQQSQDASATGDAAIAPDVSANASASNPADEAGAEQDIGVSDAVVGEVWTDGHRGVESCNDYRTVRWAETYTDPHGPRRNYGYDGYLFRRVAVRRDIGGVERVHCLRVYYPKERTTLGKPLRVADWIGPAWFRLIETTLSRLPWLHLQTVHAIVVDNRPILHGLAAFSRENPSEDARDGHTIWLNTRLFREANGWASGNYGKYWAYRVSIDGVSAHVQEADHDLFSPVLIHEIGHLVTYSVMNKSPSNPTCPDCARMCGDYKNCDDLQPQEREAYCVTSYCTGFGFASGTENFAEMYRWFYQGEHTRTLLDRHFPDCYGQLKEANAGWDAPWDLGMGSIGEYRKTLWESCGGKACRAW
ncbi:MAG: hypothetical protein FWD57_15330 [Polyangiaceae bacterium]|nr:hypothetical protein [Polyangiaceae bacterium]